MATFHPAPYGEVSSRIDKPQKFISDLYHELLIVRPYFPGDTNYIGACIDAVIDALEDVGATREFDDD